jgi:hypothetical protein
MIIDLHTHPFGNPAFDPGAAIKSRRDVVNLRRQRPDVFRSRYINVPDLTDLLVEDMNAGGIDKAFIQPGFGEDPELVAKAVSKHPQHLVGMSATRGQNIRRKVTFSSRLTGSEPPNKSITMSKT